MDTMLHYEFPFLFGKQSLLSGYFLLKYGFSAHT